LLGNGDGTFQPQLTCAVGVQPSSMVAGDFDGDGHIDLAVADAGNPFNFPADPAGVSVLLGNGDGTFQPAVKYAVGSYPASIIANDFTGDGLLDLAVADQGNVNSGGTDPGGVSVLLGNGDGTFQPQITYSAGSGPSSIVAGDFTGDGRHDLAVANSFDNTVSV